MTDDAFQRLVLERFDRIDKKIDGINEGLGRTRAAHDVTGRAAR